MLTTCNPYLHVVNFYKNTGAKRQSAMSNSNLQFNIRNSNESTILCCSNPRSPPEILKREARFFEPLKIGTEMFLLKMMFLA